MLGGILPPGTIAIKIGFTILLFSFSASPIRLSQNFDLLGLSTDSSVGVSFISKQLLGIFLFIFYFWYINRATAVSFWISFR